MASCYHLRPAASHANAALQHGWSQPSTPVKDSTSILRPLSDIREITEPSIADVVALRGGQERSGHSSGVGRQTSLKRTGNHRTGNTVRIVEPSSSPKVKGKQKVEIPPRFSSSTGSEASPDGSDTYSLPAVRIPPRQSSNDLRGLPHSDSITVDGHLFPPVPKRTPDRSASKSPARPVRARLQPSQADVSRRMPYNTFVRDPCPYDLLEQRDSKHNRVSAQLQIVAPLFVGGGTIEGFARVAIDGGDSARHRHQLLVSQISIDLMGIEELLGRPHRSKPFLSLATDLLHADHPPPADMVESTTPLSFRDCLWVLKPSVVHLPFRISLPLNVGPAPFRSKMARIRYLLSMSVHFLDNSRSMVVRQSQEVDVLSTYDPERALRSLPSPLTAFDELYTPRHGETESIRLTAGLHRQVWVSGSSIFVDVHVANKSHRNLRNLDLSVERDILYYRHASASTMEKSASQARIFQDKDQTLLKKTRLRPGKSGWNGVAPHSSVVRTCDIELPRGHTTVSCGQFFEVRYFLNISISNMHQRILSVQLPIILIHMNSLDVVPNAVSQVAAAIEEKRAVHQQTQTRKVSAQSTGSKSRLHSRDLSNASSAQSRARAADPSRMQGTAFAAPRQQSLEQHKTHIAELHHLGQTLDRSPRKHVRHNKSTRSPVRDGQQHQSQSKRHNDPARYTQQHKFALHNAPSNHSLGGLSVGSYTVLNGSNMNTNMDGFASAGLYGHSASSSVRQRLRGVRSLDSFRRVGTGDQQLSQQPHRDEKPGTTHRHVADQSATTRRQHPDQHLPPTALGMPDHRRPSARQQSSLRKLSRGRHQLSGSPEAPAASSRQQSLARRASRQLRDSFDKGRSEMAAAQHKGTTGVADWFKRIKSKSPERDAGGKESGMDW